MQTDPLRDGPPPEHLYDGEFQTQGYRLLRTPNIAVPSLLDRAQRYNQLGVLEQDANTGHVTGDVQNLRVLVSRDALKPATLVPDYGLVMDTRASVIRNIAAGAPLGK